MTTGRINQVASPKPSPLRAPAGPGARVALSLSLSVLPSVPRLWRRVPRTRGAVGAGREPSRPPASAAVAAAPDSGGLRPLPGPRLARFRSELAPLATGQPPPQSPPHSLRPTGPQTDRPRRP